MKEMDAMETAYKNGEEDGYKKGFNDAESIYALDVARLEGKVRGLEKVVDILIGNIRKK